MPEHRELNVNCPHCRGEFRIRIKDRLFRKPLDNDVIEVETVAALPEPEKPIQ